MTSDVQRIRISTRSGDEVVFDGDNFDIREHLLGFYVVIDLQTDKRVWTETIRGGRRGVTSVTIENYKHAKADNGDA